MSKISITLALLMAAVATTSVAQDDGPRFLRVNMVTVKPDKVDEFITLRDILRLRRFNERCHRPISASLVELAPIPDMLLDNL